MVKGKLTKADIKKLEEKLLSKPTLVWDKLSDQEKTGALNLAEDYKAFLNASKTEREAVREILKRIQPLGYMPMDHAPLDKAARNPKACLTHLGKMAALTVKGKRPPTEGLRLIISHLDAPRLDLKPKAVFEELDLAFLKTHYYGGIKKYQWFSRPLAIHAFVVKSDGRSVDIVVGESDDDPVFTIADLLPHLSRKIQADKKVNEAFVGEKMNLLAGSLPLGDDEVKNRFKLALLELLNQRWGLVEEDFISAEVEVVPAGKARDVGFDRGLIGGYGQDDRICTYSSLSAILGVERPDHTCAAVYVDKEEIGSDGATGAKSRFIETLAEKLLEQAGLEPTSANVRRTLMNTKALSADVEGAMDPDYQEVHEKMNAARLGYGLCLTRYTGGGGKYGASEAPAELMGWVRKVYKDAGVIWQSSLLGRIDEGGGGTVAMYLAEYGMEIVDSGPSMLGMHSPFEISSKADLLMAVRGYQAFFQA